MAQKGPGVAGIHFASGLVLAPATSTVRSLVLFTCRPLGVPHHQTIFYDYLLVRALDRWYLFVGMHYVVHSSLSGFLVIAEAELSCHIHRSVATLPSRR